MIVSTTGERLTSVSCLGYKDREADGVFLRDVSAWQNEYSNESALFRTSGGGIARINEFRRVGWSENPNAASVRLNVYGTRASFEEHGNGKVWNQVDSEEPEDVTDLLRCEQDIVSEAELATLPEGLIYNFHTGFARVHPRERLPREFHGLNNGHEGSHLFLVDDFVRACRTMELPPNHVWQAARYNVPGMIAHQSALRDGETLSIPDLGDPPSPHA
jgi:hypothetical protein